MATTRRSFLGHLVFGLFALAVGIVGRMGFMRSMDLARFGHSSRPAATGEVALETCLRALWPRPWAAGRVGREYLLCDHRAEADARYLARLLQRGASVSAESIAALIRQRRQRDFERDRVVFVDGWLLARTEAELAALFVLLPGANP